MERKMDPGCIARHRREKAVQLALIEAHDKLFIKQLNETIPPLLAQFITNTDVIKLLVEYGRVSNHFTESELASDHGIPSLSVFRSRIRGLRRVWKGVVRIRIRPYDDHKTQIVFDVLPLPEK